MKAAVLGRCGPKEVTCPPGRRVPGFALLVLTTVFAYFVSFMPRTHQTHQVPPLPKEARAISRDIPGVATGGGWRCWHPVGTG